MLLVSITNTFLHTKQKSADTRLYSPKLIKLRKSGLW